MHSVYWAALAIGGSTLLGTACGFLCNHISENWNDVVTAFAAGVMLAAACFGLFAPAMEQVCGVGVLLLPAGVFCGAGLLRGAERLSGRIGGGLHRHPELLFVLALAIHKFPEGMAGGVGLNGMNPAAARTVVIGVALQNLPEGIVMIPPLLASGMGRGRAAAIALATGLLNALGVFAGALWGSCAAELMPFALSLAGGAMLDVIAGQMIPQLKRHGKLILLGGFTMMGCINALF